MDAWATRDWDALVDAFAPDAQIDLRRLHLPDTGVLHGGSALAEWLGGLFEHFPDFEFGVDELAPAGEWVVARGSMRARGQMGGVELEQRYSEAVLVRGGRIVRDVFFAGIEAPPRRGGGHAPPVLPP